VKSEAKLKMLGGDNAVAATDFHSFPEGYPNVGQKINSPVQPGSYLFGNRYRTNPFGDEITIEGKTSGYGDPKFLTNEQGVMTGNDLYKPKVSFEQMNAGFRKYSSAMRDDIADPMNKGYRLGKDLSRVQEAEIILQRFRRNETRS
jgi:hypothetical protein